MKTLILGLGNPILSDDAIGIRIVQELKKVIPNADNIDFVEASIAGISILDEITGYDRLILIDSIRNRKGNAGEVYKMKMKDLNITAHLASSHGMDFVTAIELGQRVGYQIPKVIDIYAIEIENNTIFREKLSSKVETSIPKIIDTIMEENKGKF